MKNTILFLLTILSLSATAQSVTLKVGTGQLFSIDNQDYERGYITYRWFIPVGGTDTLIELSREYNTSQPFRKGRVVGFYKDGDNGSAAFTTFDRWRTWWRAHAGPVSDTVVASGGGGATLVKSTFNAAGDATTYIFTTTVPSGAILTGQPWVQSGGVVSDRDGVYAYAFYNTNISGTTLTTTITQVKATGAGTTVGPIDNGVTLVVGFSYR